jgi:HAMP domain-containing protein
MSDTDKSSPKTRYRRRRILVDPAYQLRVAATILVGILFYSGLLGFLLFYPLMQEFENAGSTQQQFWIAQQVLELHARFWPSVAVVAVLVAVQSLFVTHRVVGPAYHIRRVLNGLAAGAFTMRVRLRRFDRLKEVEAAVNTLAEQIELRERSRIERDEQLRTIVGVLADETVCLSFSSAGQDALAKLRRLALDSDKAV